MMNASQFYALSRQLQNAYAAQMRPLCEETGMAQTAIDILLFLHNNPGCDTARDICTYRQLKPALVSLYVENLVQSGHLRRESVPEDRPQMPPAADRPGASRRRKGAGLAGGLHGADVRPVYPKRILRRDSVVSPPSPKTFKPSIRKDLPDMQTKDQSFLGTEPVGKLLVRLAVPDGHRPTRQHAL